MCSRSLKDSFSYQLGRLLSYELLALITGSIGQAFYQDLFNSNLPGILIAILCILIFFKSISILRKGLFSIHTQNKFLKKLFKTKFSSLFIGFSSGFLPCGFLYTFLMLALSFADLKKSMFTLFILWITSIPALSFLPILLKKFEFNFSNHLKTKIIVFSFIFSLLNLGLKGKELHFLKQTKSSFTEVCFPSFVKRKSE